MKFTLFPLAGLVPALVVAPLHAQGLGEPVLSTPGSATWLTETTTTGTRMVFTITGNTVLDWGQFNLAGGSELIFDFAGGTSVANMLNGTAPHTIGGTVTSNGNVGFFSPNATLRVTGTVTANQVTLATMDVDPQAFNAGGTHTLTAGSGATLNITGTVSATRGSVVLAGRSVRIGGTGEIAAARAIRIGGGQSVTVHQSGADRRLKTAGDGFVLHLGRARAPRIEVAAGKEININGRLDTGRRGDSRIFLEVGQGGTIYREGSGIIVGDSDIDGNFDNKGTNLDHDDEIAAAMNSSTVKMPALKRPDGSSVSSSRTLVNDVPVSASADSGRDRKRAAQQGVASRGKAKPLVQRASFFGMRGGSEKR